MTIAERDRRADALRGPTAGAAIQLGLLAVLSAVWGLGPAGWLAGTTYALASATLLAAALSRSPRGQFGPADLVTLARSTLVGSVTALVASDLAGRPADTVVLVSIATAALLLDAVDGRVARATATVSPLGARFDMEVDAFLLAALSVHLIPSLGPWVLAIGGMRYAFVAAGWVLPWLRGPLTPTRAGRSIAAIQGVILVTASSGVLEPQVAAILAVFALTLLTWSFGRDVGRLWRARSPKRKGVLSD